MKHKKQLLQGSGRTVSEVLRQTLELEVIKQAVGSCLPSGCGKQVTECCGGVGPLLNERRYYRQLTCQHCRSTNLFQKFCLHKPVPSQTKEETTDNLHAGAIGTPATFRSSVPTNRKKKGQYIYGLLETSSLKEGAVQYDHIAPCMVMAV
jgi:hypothetical protein